VYDVLCRFWIPEESIEERVRTHRVPYDAWEREGWVIATDGNVIDYREIREEILRIREQFPILQIGYDPWGSQAIVNDLADENIDMVKVVQNFTNLSPPTKELERMVLAKTLRHGGHPVLRWMADNLEVREDPSGNAVRPVKPGSKMSHKKIDGMVGLIEAIDRAVRNDGSVDEPSVYEKEERGLLLV
jgi:phage terminase large subunit-like protein